MVELKGKSALVTGAGRGVGLGIARALAVQGARVVINDLFPERAAEACHPLRQQGLAAEHCAFDVTDYAQVSAAVGALGTIDILVNNAGIPGVEGMELKQFIDTTPAEWRPQVDLNLYGTLNCTHAVLPGMRDRGWGRIVMVSSDAGRAGSGAGVTVYGSCKAAAVQLVRNLSQEVASLGVTVNAIALGPMDNLPDEYAKWTVRAIPVARMGRPDDAGAAVVYLASEEAGWVTGQLLAVNGGMNPS
jgi:2-hydroxycyclohexanecarboxyl-CoA dehydrogenase